MFSPKVAIGLPVYNGERYLEETLESLLAQTFQDFVLLIVDNASSDRTAAIAQRAVARDPRVHYVRNDTNIGGLPNHNRAFEVAQERFGAPYFHWATYDDLLHPDYLAQAVDVLDARPEVGLVYTGLDLIDDDGDLLPYSDTLGGYLLPDDSFWRYRPNDTDGLLDPNPVTRYAASLGSGPATYVTHGVIRASTLASTRLFLIHGVEDVMMAELALRAPFARIDAPLFQMRLHRHSTHYMSREEYLRYEGGEASSPATKGSYRRSINFALAALRARMPFSMRLHALLKLGRFAFRPTQLKRLLLPGPNNYFGINFSGALPHAERPPTLDAEIR